MQPAKEPEPPKPVTTEPEPAEEPEEPEEEPPSFLPSMIADYDALIDLDGAIEGFEAERLSEKLTKQERAKKEAELKLKLLEVNSYD